ncbi:hypothetical protein HNQ50_003013 [Silvimonas terrae]|uniref:Secreted protein n=1 Tax=Silvimonas terrae TaxID=300266 RepID=A0A840RJ51_9NEIS|nr:hypothetical protein [Silvimonas terrae]MBB5192272.1 hypothetical protein [Silvimonas terrae]
MRLSSIASLGLAASLCVCFTSAAYAGAPQAAVDAYANMCVQMANDGHIGDVDLKGNPKLQTYCGCFGRKFADRAVTKTEPLKTKAEQQQAQKEEMEMRNSCRADNGLPPVPPKK